MNEELSREDIIEKYKTKPNGPYITSICLGCDRYTCDPEGKINDAKIYKECKACAKIDFEEAF